MCEANRAREEKVKRSAHEDKFLGVKWSQASLTERHGASLPAPNVFAMMVLASVVVETLGSEMAYSSTPERLFLHRSFSASSVGIVQRFLFLFFSLSRKSREDSVLKTHFSYRDRD